MSKTKTEMVKKQEAIEIQVMNAEQSDQIHMLGILQGAKQVANGLQKLVSAQVINTLDAFQKEEKYKALGFDTFVDFLNNSPYAPMKKDEYYDRKALLDKEGESTYDALNSLNLPVYRRKALAAGAIRVEGEMVLIGGEDGQEERVPITETRRLKQILKDLTDANVVKSDALEVANRKLAKALKDKESAESEVEDLHEQLAAAGDPLTAGIEPSGLVLGIAQLEQGFRTLENYVQTTKPKQQDIDDLCERLEKRLNQSFRAFGLDIPEGI
jgi:hypothetical protein